MRQLPRWVKMSAAVVLVVVLALATAAVALFLRPNRLPELKERVNRFDTSGFEVVATDENSDVWCFIVCGGFEYGILLVPISPDVDTSCEALKARAEDWVDGAVNEILNDDPGPIDASCIFSKKVAAGEERVPGTAATASERTRLETGAAWLIGAVED